MKYLLLPSLILFGELCSGQLFKCPNEKFEECARCTSDMDPHIVTFDGVFYDHHKDCCYQYVTQCPKAVNPVPFEICGCHYKCRPVGRCIGDVSISFFDSSGNKQFDIFINYLTPLAPAYDVITVGSLTSGNVYGFNAGDVFKYTLSGNEHIFEIFGAAPYYGYVSYIPGNLRVFLDTTYFVESACGLCGLFDIDPDNDFTGSDNVLYVTPADSIFWPTLRYGQNGAVLNGKINNFADTYPCEPEEPPVKNPRGFTDCFNLARDCCTDLWNQLSQNIQWINPIVSADAIFDNWLEGCIGDVCLEKDNEFEDCDILEGIYQFAEDIYIETATKTFG